MLPLRSVGTRPGPAAAPPTTLILPPAIRRAMVDQAMASRPMESVGILATVRAGATVRAVAWFPGTNVDASPVRYTMDPADARSALGRIAASGWEPGGIVHSHPEHAAVPSRTDRREHRYPDALMVIISLAGQRPDVRAWCWLPGDSFAGGRMAEVAIRVRALPTSCKETW